ncbi:putative myosin light chain kinase 3 [Paramecium bursaria]
MGICQGKRPIRKPYVLPLIVENKFNKIELDFLYMIFQDLSQRNVEGIITKSSFSDFFTMIGLWGDLVFDYFNKTHTDSVDFCQFLQGIEYFIKCDEEQKIEHLFRLYDLNHEGNIKKEQFLQMLQNYPREDILTLLDDQQFLKDEQILKYYEKKVDKTKQKPVRADESDATESLRSIARRKSSIQQSQPGSSSNLPIKEESVNMMFPNPSMVGQNGVPMGNFGQNVTFTIDGREVELKRININQLIKKYVNMIYKEKKEQQLSMTEFKQFVKLHPKIFHGLYKAFNFDIWGIDNEKQIPRFHLVQKDIEGTLHKVSKKPQKNAKNTKPRYFKLIQHFCLSFKTKDSPQPTRIICLDGLVISELIDNQNQQYGFDMTHKDQLYKKRQYYCENYEDFQKWTKNLQIFQKSNVQDFYSIQQKIGEGKFSIVYLCEDKKTKEQMAIKIIEKFKLTKSEKLMLAHETEIMKLLNHSCIIKFKEIIETKTHLNIITEVVRDGDLFDYIQKQDLLCEQEASLIMSQLFDTLNYIHSIGIVHRDLKPENIMIVLDESKQKIKHVKIIDFGFANFLANIQQKEGDAICGTTNYLAPETLQNQCVSFKVDNFALGVILYLMLSGYLPFDSEFPEEIIKNIIDCKYELEEDFWKQISEEAKDLVKRLLCQDPQDRLNLVDAMQHPWIVNRKNLPIQKAKKPKQKNFGF